MAVISSGSIQMHLHRVRDWGFALKGKYGGIIERLVHEGSNPYLLIVNMENIVTTTLKASAPHLTDTEVFPANSKLGLSGGTPAKVVLVSDNGADDGVVYVMGWGLDGNEKSKLIAEEMTLEGKTNVSSVREYYEVFHMYGLKDVTGNVILKTLAGTTLLTITSGSKHSNGSGFTVPLGWQCLPYFITLNQDTILNRFYDTTWLTIKKIEKDSDDNEDGLQEIYWFCVSILSPNNQLKNPTGGKVLHRHNDDNENELRIEHHLSYQVNATTISGSCAYVLWKQTISETITD